MICLSHQNWCGFFSLVTNMNSFRRTIIIQQCRDDCVAFFVAMKQRKEKNNEQYFYEEKTDSAASGIYGNAYGTVYAGEFTVQHRRQLFCGKDQ